MCILKSLLPCLTLSLDLKYLLQATVFKHLFQRWNHCFGKLWDFWNIVVQQVDVSHWVWTYQFYPRPWFWFHTLLPDAQWEEFLYSPLPLWGLSIMLFSQQERWDRSIPWPPMSLPPLSCFCQIFHHSHSDEKFTNTPFSLGSELSFPSVDIRLSSSTHPNFLTIPLAPVIIPLSLSPHSERLPTTHQNHDTEAKAQIYLS